MNKKSQITLFIIIGVIIIISVSLFFLLNKKEVDDKMPVVNLAVAPVKEYVDLCLEEIIYEAIYSNFLQGGYYFVPEPYDLYFDFDIPVYWNKNQSFVPTEDIIKEHLIYYITDHFYTCFDFSIFDEQGYNISYEGIDADLSISDNNIVFAINSPIYIEKDNVVHNLNNYKIAVKFDFFKIYNLGLMLNEKQKEYPNSIPLGFMFNLANENDFRYEIITLDDGVILFTMIFDEYYFNQPFIYSFVHRYEIEETSTRVLRDVIIEPIPKFVINESRLFKYQVKATGNNVTFSAHTSLFDINSKTGEIEFDPSYLPNGERNILIKAKDDKGNEDFAYMTILIDFGEKKLPIVESIGTLNAVVGEEFNYKVNANDPSDTFLFFHDDTSLFDIGLMDGVIKFTPEFSGNYTIKFTILNGEGRVYEYMRLEIE
jgi:hypothetical protein